jgi:hypothetical protein
MSKVSGNRGLNFSASLNIESARKNAEDLKKILNDLKIQSASAGLGPKGFEVKPLTEYQAAQVKIKQEALALTKAKNEQAAADKAASLVLQDALKAERLARAEILTQIQQNKLALQEQAAIEKAAKAQANIRPGTIISNSQSEIDTYATSTKGSMLYTSAINAETVARARLNTEAAVQAVNEGTLRTEQTFGAQSTRQATEATIANNLTKKQAAQLLAEEKYILQQNNAELKNNAREQLNAKGSLEQRRAALIRLNSAYDRLSASERATPAGQRLQGIVADVTTQVKGLEEATGRAQRNVGNYMGAFTGGVSKLWSGLRLVAQMLPGIGIAGILAFAAEPIINYLSNLDIFKEKLTQIKANINALNEVQKSANSQAGAEIANLKILYTAATDVANSTKDRTLAAQELKKEFPAAFANSKLTAILNGEESKTYKQLTADILENATAKAATSKIEELSNKRLDAVFQKQKINSAESSQLSNYSKFQAQNKINYDKGQSLLKPGSIQDVDNVQNIKDDASNAIKIQDAQIKLLDGQEAFLLKYVAGSSKLVSALSGSAKLIKDPLERFDSLVEAASSKADIDNIKTALQTRMDALAPNDKQIANYQAKIRQLEEVEKKYTPKLSDGKAETKAMQSAISSRNNLQAQIDALTKRGTDTELSANEQQVESVKAKYAKMLQAAVAFNNNPSNKAKGLRVDAGGIASAQKDEVNAVTYSQGTTQYKTDLDEQRKLYVDYEDYKLKVGKQKADERYKNEVDTSKTYMQQLQEALDTVDPVADKTGIRRKMLTDEIKAQKLVRQKADDEIYANAYQSALTHSQRLIEVDRDYQQKRKALGASATKDQLGNLQLEKDAAIRSANEANAVKLSGYDELMQNLDAMTRGQILKQLQAEKDGYLKQYKDKLITAEFYAQKIAQINSIEDGLVGNNIFKGIENAIKRYKEAKKAFDQSGSKEDATAVLNAKSDMYSKISEGASQVSGAIGDISSSLDELGLSSDQAKKSLNDVMGVVSGAGTLAKGIATSNPVDIITGSIKLLTSAISLFNNKDIKLQAKIDAYKNQLDSLGAAYAKLDRAVNNSVGESVYGDSKKQIDNLKAQQAALIGMRDTESKKKKADEGKIKDYNAQIDAIPGKIDDITKAISQNLIQTNFKDLSNNLADALASAFASGENSAKSFDDVFRNVISNAIKNSLKLKILDPIIKKFTDDLSAYAGTHDNSVIGFDFNAYKDQLKAAGDLFSAGLKGSEEYFKSVGLDSGSAAKSGGITAQIATSITQDQASELTGLYRAQYDITKQSNGQLINLNKTAFDAYGIAKQNFDVAVQIQVNTANTVVELQNAVVELKAINKNTTAQSSRSFTG